MSNSCTGCGAENHHFAFKCSSCGNPLQKVETTTISTEEIIAQLSLWTGRLRESKGNDIEINRNQNKISYSFEDVSGITRQYLGLLKARSITQPEIIAMYNDFKREVEVDIPTFHKLKEKQGWKLLTLAVFVALALYALLFYGKKHGWF